MKAKDLRIGNLIQAEWDNKYCAEVTANNGSSIWVDLQGDLEEDLSRYLELDLEYVTPIPLTEEWLLKMNFRQILSSRLIFRVDIDGYEFELDASQDKFYYEGLEIKAIHQLQNLIFALCGEELTIKEPIKRK